MPNPEVRVNSPGAVVRPEKDQLPGACKNWFSVERWVDVSNDHYGVTWVTADAPLMELGGLTANLPRSQPNPDAYMKTIEPSATLVLLGDEQSLAHELSSRPGRRNDLPLLSPPARGV